MRVSIYYENICIFKEECPLGMKNGPVSKFIEIGKEAQQQFICFKTVNVFQI